MALRGSCSRRVRELLACLLCAATMCVLGQQGPPNNANITDIGVSASKFLVTLHFTVTDASDAPARGVLVDIPGLESGSVLFTYPLQNIDSHTFSYTLHTLLNETVPMNYVIRFTPFNSFGNGSAVSIATFLPGSNFHVNISTSSRTLPELTNFTISCTTNNPYIKIINLLIDGINSSNYSNVIVTQWTNTSVSYIFMSTQRIYNGSNFTCFGQLNSNPGSVPRTSDAIFINVLYAPRFQDYNNATNWLEFPISSSFEFSCSLNSTGNPPLKTGISYISTTTDFSNVERTLTNTSLVYAVSNATINNRVNLTCVANSSYAVTTANYLAFVGGLQPSSWGVQDSEVETPPL